MEGVNPIIPKRYGTRQLTTEQLSRRATSGPWV